MHLGPIYAPYVSGYYTIHDTDDGHLVGPTFHSVTIRRLCHETPAGSPLTRNLNKTSYLPR